MKRFPIVSPNTKITKHHQTPKGSPSFSFVRLASTGRTVVMGGESAPRSDLSLCSLAIKQGKCHGDSNLHQFPMLWRSFLGWILKFRTVIGAAEKAPWTYWPMRFDRMELGLTNPTDWKKHWSWPKWKQRRRRERMRLQHHICARAPSFSWTQHKKWQIWWHAVASHRLSVWFQYRNHASYHILHDGHMRCRLHFGYIDSSRFDYLRNLHASCLLLSSL